MHFNNNLMFFNKILNRFAGKSKSLSSPSSKYFVSGWGYQDFPSEKEGVPAPRIQRKLYSFLSLLTLSQDHFEHYQQIVDRTYSSVHRRMPNHFPFKNEDQRLEPFSPFFPNHISRLQRRRSSLQSNRKAS